MFPGAFPDSLCHSSGLFTSFSPSPPTPVWGTFLLNIAESAEMLVPAWAPGMAACQGRGWWALLSLQSTPLMEETLTHGPHGVGLR